jgi:hypothetical protein
MPETSSPRALQAGSIRPDAPASARKRPERGRLDQSALAVTWNSTTLPCPSGARVTSGVPSVSEAMVRSDRAGSGCAMTWLSTVTSSGMSSPKNGEVSGNGLSALGSPQDMAPPTVRPPTRSRTGISGPAASRATSDAARRGPAKRTSRPPRSTQSISAVPRRARASRHQRGSARRDWPAACPTAPLHQLGGGGERLPEVVQRRQRAPAPSSSPWASIRATSRRCSASSVSVTAPAERSPAISKRVIRLRSSGRQVEHRRGGRFTGSSSIVCRARSRGMPAGSRPWATTVSSRGAGRGGVGHRSGSCRPRSSAATGQGCPARSGKPRPDQPRPKASSRSSRPLWARPSDIQNTSASMIEPCDPFHRGGVVRRRRGWRDRRQAGGPCIGGLERQIAGGQVVRPRRIRAGPNGLPRPAGRLPARSGRRPVPRRGPGGIHDDQERTIASPFRLRVQDGPAKPTMAAATASMRKQQKPPRRLVRLAVVVLQTQQKRHAGKPPPDRRGRDGAQQPPKDRQRKEGHRSRGVVKARFAIMSAHLRRRAAEPAFPRGRRLENSGFSRPHARTFSSAR